MKTLRIKKTGKIVKVENGVAHGMIERGEAEIHHEPFKAPKDKMMSGKRKNVRNK